MAQTLTQIRQHLDAYGLRPKHRFGQNFLHDANKMGQILAAAELQLGELVLEVGPGTGALSEHLLEAGANLLAVEIDSELEPILKKVFEPCMDRASILIGDVLDGKHNLNRVVLEALAGRPFKLIANLPYNVASPLLVNLALQQPNMSGAVVMIQKEVADRLAASPGSKAYGPLGIIIQSMCHVQMVTTLPPACFWPAPKVASAVVAIHRRQTPLTDDPAKFSQFVHHVFNQRRKQLGSILGKAFVFPDKVNPTQRPEELSVEQLVRLAGGFVDEAG